MGRNHLFNVASILNKERRISSLVFSRTTERPGTRPIIEFETTAERASAGHTSFLKVRGTRTGQFPLRLLFSVSLVSSPSSEIPVPSPSPGSLISSLLRSMACGSR